VPGEISIIGFGDVMEPTAYEDHKTTKNFRYCENEDSLAENVQMIVGAAEVLTRAIERAEDPDFIRIAHNYFLKDPQQPTVKKVECTLTPKYIQDFWFDVIVPTSEKMLDLKRNTPDDWSDIACPTKKGVCNKYGGCPFKGICGGSETIDTYKERLAFTKAMSNTKTTERKNEMSIFDDIRKKRAAAGNAPETTETEPEVTPTTEVTEDEEDDLNLTPPLGTIVAPVEGTRFPEGPVTLDRAPWAIDGCVACSGNPVPGYNSKGTACRACTRRSDIKTTEFKSDVVGNEDGTANLQLTRKKDGQVYLLPAIKKATTKATNTAKPPVETAKKETPPAEARKAIQTGEKKKVGRPKEGFTLIYGTVKRGKRNEVDLNLVLKDMGQELATAQGVESYYQLDFGKRRDYLAIKAQAIAESFGAADVVVSNLQDADVRAFAAAIEPYAMRVIMAGV
jgi:hypothetical protein